MVQELRLPGLQGVILELSALEDELFEVPKDESFLVVVVGLGEVSRPIAAILASDDDGEDGVESADVRLLRGL